MCICTALARLSKSLVGFVVALVLTRAFHLGTAPPRLRSLSAIRTNVAINMQSGFDLKQYVADIFNPEKLEVQYVSQRLASEFFTEKDQAHVILLDLTVRYVYILDTTDSAIDLLFWNLID